MKRVLSVMLTLALIMSVIGTIPVAVSAASMSDADFFPKFDLTTSGMEDVKTAVDSKDYTAAKREFVKYLSERKAEGNAAAFPITEAHKNYGQAVLPLDNILTGPYEFDVWLNRFTVTGKDYELYEVDLTEKTAQELNNQAISVMLFERQKQAFPVLVASKEYEDLEPVLVIETVEGDTYEIMANHDTYVNSGSTGTTYGNAKELYVKEQSDSLSSPFGSQTRRAYINFSLEEAANKTVEKATMKLYARLADDATVDSLDVHVISVGDTMWDENRLTWATIGGNIYSYQNADVPTWQKPSGADNEYENVTARFWYARSMAYEYLTYLADPVVYANEHPLYPDGSIFGEKLIDLMDAFATQKGYGYNRTLETGERLNRWVDVLDALIDTPAVQNNPDKVCNIISFMWGDCNSLATKDITNGSYWWSNWRIVANAGFYKANEYFSEWKNYTTWRNKADYNVNYTLDLLFVDDMSFAEAGPAYAVWCVELFGDCVRMAELNGRPMDKTFTEKLRYATRFALESIYPDGYDTNIGDSNYKDRMSVFADLDEYYGNDSIINAFVNGEDEGAEYFSSIYHDSNTMLMRNSWNPDEAVYLQFNNNPFDGHAHPDSAAVVMYAYGKPLLVDSGRYSYSNFNTIYNDLRYASAHNTIEAVGASMSSHSGAAKPLEYAVTNDVFDFATTSQSGYSGVTHTRNVFFVKDGYSIVTDYVTGNQNREYRQNWHFMPSSNAEMSGKVATTNFYNEANIVIANAGSDTALIRDGFHSADYGLVAGAKYASYGKTGSDVKFDTVLYPTREGEVADVVVTDLAEGDNSKAAIEITIDDETSYYYVKNNDNADGLFSDYETDAKMAYVFEKSRNNKSISIVNGKTLSNIINSENNITSLNVRYENGNVYITGENLVPSTNSDAILMNFENEVSAVYLNGAEIEFRDVYESFESLGFYAVRSTDISGSGDISYNGKEYNIVGENIITNGDFSDGTTDWTNASTGAQYSGTVSSVNAHGESMSLTNTASAGGNTASTLRRFVPIEGGKSYYLSYYAYATAATTGNAQMSAAVLTKGGPVFGSFNGLSYYNYKTYGGMNSWSSEGSNTHIGGSVGRADDLYAQGMNHKEFVFNAPEEAEHIMLSFFAWTDTGRLYLSDFELYELEEIVNEDEVATTVTVEFVDSEGNSIADSITEEIGEGEIYIYEAPETITTVDEYFVLDKTNSTLSCKTVKGENVIGAVYNKVGLVTVKHVDEEGNEIADNETYECAIGTAFNGDEYAKTNLIFESKVYNYVENADDVIVVSAKISENVIELTYEESDVSFDGKLAHFTFDDEETGFNSEFAKAENSGTNTLSNDAMRGKSLYLNGSGANFLSVTNADGEALLTGLDEITVVFYAKVAGSDANWALFMAPDTASQVYANEHYVGMLHNGSNMKVERYNNGRTPTIDMADSTGVWKKYALVIKESMTTLYIDGVSTSLDSANKLTDILGSNSIIQIGKANWGSGEYFNGYIDEFMIYNYALSEKEIADIGGSSKVTVSFVDKNGSTLKASEEITVLSGVELTESVIDYEKLMTVDGVDYMVKTVEGLGKVADGSDMTVKVVYAEAVSSETTFNATRGDSLRSATDSSLSDFASEAGGDYPARLMTDNRWYKRAGLAGFEVTVPANEIITKATVKLHVNASNGTTGAAIYDASQLPEDWERGNVSGFALPAEPITRGVVNGAYITFDVTDYVTENGNVSFAVFTTTADQYIIYDSELTSYIPQLIVETAKEKLTSFEIVDNKAVYTSYDGENATVAVIYYSINNEVIKVVTDSGNGETVSVAIESDVADAVAYKAIVWNSKSGMKPIMPAITGEF
ncbi:MAG: heparinase II/III family protein, partial [Clostridia bacterium]|nr:heparinase II/III family protein [Clostridia bacterium]